GSKSKFDTPGHIAMPPGVKFKKNPNNEGEVSSGVVSNVKINGKEAAVLGSMVKTCNDPQPQETCTIIAVGAPVILPILMPGMDPDQFEKDGGTVFNNGEPVTTKAKTRQADKQPKLQNPKWNKDKAKIGEEVTLCVDCVDQYEMANVTFTIWEGGSDREKDAPVVVLKGQNMDGKAEAKWRYSIDEFEYKNPPSDVIDYIEERLGIIIDPAKKQFIINDYKDDFDNPIKQTAKFYFTVKSFRCDIAEADVLEIGARITVTVYDEWGKPLKKAKYKMIGPDGKESEGETGDDGKIDEQGMIPGQHQIQIIIDE
ncbi:MAG: hypothetical protein JXB88_16635, partial [Spirochaetales bacterium]|nr:hypothetical protein [Spirochaetales bacterium]